MDIFAGFSVTAVISLHLNLTKEAGDLELSLIEQPKPFFIPFFSNLLIHVLQKTFQSL